jgi:hypothetical protein
LPKIGRSGWTKFYQQDGNFGIVSICLVCRSIGLLDWITRKEEKMTRSTRRKFFKRASVGAAAIGSLAVLPGTVLAGNSEAVGASLQSAEQVTTFANLDQHMVLHIDPQSRKMVLMYGDQEKVFDNMEVLSRLLDAARKR